jgi:cytidylate kinase
MQAYYGVKWLDHNNYDLALDTSVFGIEGSAEVIIRAVEAR